MRRPIAALLGLLLLTACAPRGDFGRARAFLPEDAAVFDATVTGTARPGALIFPYTDDEIELRSRAAGLLEPPTYTRSFLIDPVPPDLYAEELLGPFHISATARYARLRDDVTADSERIEPFRQLAIRVAQADAVRERAAATMPEVKVRDRADAFVRIEQNRRVVAKVHRKLAHRLQDYRRVLNRLVLAVPDRDAVGVERALTALEMQIRSIGAP